MLHATLEDGEKYITVLGFHPSDMKEMLNGLICRSWATHAIPEGEILVVAVNSTDEFKEAIAQIAADFASNVTATIHRTSPPPALKEALRVPKPPPILCEAELARAKDAEGNPLQCAKPALYLGLYWRPGQDYDGWYCSNLCQLHKTVMSRDKGRAVRIVPLANLDHTHEFEEPSNVGNTAHTSED